jgi:predicted MPP superfamily phosphohydrolase
MIKIFLVIIISVLLITFILAHLYEVKVDVAENDGKRSKVFADAILNDEKKNLIHFVQISDLHLSKFRDSSRISDFRLFCAEVVDLVQPKVVIASGDLTDAKDKVSNEMGQYLFN